MKIYDYFQFFDEDMMLDLRLNILNEYVHKFIVVENGGWHFVNVKTPEEIKKKLKNFGHHWEYTQISGLNLNDIKNMVNENRVIYDYHADMRESKWSGKEKLVKCNLSELPKYIVNNQNKYSSWLE